MLYNFCCFQASRFQLQLIGEDREFISGKTGYPAGFRPVTQSNSKEFFITHFCLYVKISLTVESMDFFISGRSI